MVWVRLFVFPLIRVFVDVEVFVVYGFAVDVRLAWGTVLGVSFHLTTTGLAFKGLHCHS